MGTGIEHDLSAFERGELSREALETMHGRALGPVLDAYERMRSLGSLPVGDADAGWAGLRSLLDAQEVIGSRTETGSSDRRRARAAGASRRGVRSKRTVVLLLAATLTLGGSAFASTGGFGLMHGGDAGSLDPVADRGGSPRVDQDSDGSDQSQGGGQGDHGHGRDEESDDDVDRAEDAEANDDDEVDESGRDGDESDGGDGRDGDGDGSDESGGDGEESGESE